jgi:hypothetical protein
MIRAPEKRYSCFCLGMGEYRDGHHYYTQCWKTVEFHKDFSKSFSTKSAWTKNEIRLIAFRQLDIERMHEVTVYYGSERPNSECDRETIERDENKVYKFK